MRSIGEIAAALGAEAVGDATLRIARPAHPAEAEADDLALAMDPRLLGALRSCPARAALLPPGADWSGLGLKAAVLVGRPRLAMAAITGMYAIGPEIAPGAHPLASIDPTAEIAGDAAVGPFALIGARVRVGAGARVLGHASIGEDAEIGAGCLIRAGARIGARVRIGARTIVHENAVIGADGFSFVTPERGSVESAKETGAVDMTARNLVFRRIHSLGSVEIGADCEIGAGSTIDRGTVRDTRVGAGTKIDNQVQIGHNVRIGGNCLLCAQVGVAGSAEIGDRVVLGGKAGVADHVRIGSDCVIGATSSVASNAPARSVLMGTPAWPREDTIASVIALRRLPKLAQTVAELKKRLSALDSSR